MSARHRADKSCGITGTPPHPAEMTARVAERTTPLAAPTEPLGCSAMSRPPGAEVHAAPTAGAAGVLPADGGDEVTSGTSALFTSLD
jgi:hypothetical protein